MNLDANTTSMTAAGVAASIIGAPTLWLFIKKVFLKSALADADMKTVSVYVGLISQLEKTNKHLTDQLIKQNESFKQIQEMLSEEIRKNEQLIEEVRHLRGEIEYLNNEMRGKDMRKSPRE